MSEELPASSHTVISADKALKNFDPEATLTFFVGWVSGISYQLRRIDLHVDIEREFRGIADELINGPSPGVCNTTVPFISLTVLGNMP